MRARLQDSYLAEFPSKKLSWTQVQRRRVPWMIAAGSLAAACTMTRVDAVIPELAAGQGGLSGSSAPATGGSHAGASGAVVQFDCRPRAAMAEAGYSRIMVGSAPLCITLDTSPLGLVPSVAGARLQRCGDGQRLWELIGQDELDAFEVRSAARDLYLALAPVHGPPRTRPDLPGAPGRPRGELIAVPRRGGGEVFRFIEVDMNHYVISPTSRPAECLAEHHGELGLQACDPAASEQRWSLIPGGCPASPSE